MEPQSPFARFCFFFLLWAIGSAQAAPPPPVDLPDVVERVSPSVVNISSTAVVQFRSRGWDQFFDAWGIPRERKHTSLGSGVVIDSAGFVLTNNHVIEGADEVLVTFMDKTQLKATIVGRDPKLDLALLQVKPKGNSRFLVPAELGNSEGVRIAEAAIAIGNPFGLQHTVTMGIISAKNRSIGLGPFDNFLQTDASINPGNSGGPLFNRLGQVIGINTAIFSRSQESAGVGFAIPVNLVKDVVPDLKKYGRVPRPWLGVLAQTVTPLVAIQYGLNATKGVLVYNLVQGGPADRAGFKLGDIILGVNSVETTEPYEVERELAKLKDQKTAQLQIMRGTSSKKMEIKIQELPARLKELPEGII